MGRYPFEELSRSYMDTMRGVYAEETWKTKDRRFRRMNRDMLYLKKENMISTTSPKTMTSDDVKVILQYHRDHVSESDMNHEVAALKGLLEYCNNNAVSVCFARFPGMKPHNQHHRKPSFEESVYNRILRAANKVPSEDFRRLQAYTLVLMCLTTGTRNKEIRNADLADLDLDKWIFQIIHVKGEDSYGQPRDVPIHPDIRPLLLRYVAACRIYKMEHNIDSPALFITDRCKDDHMQSNAIRVLKGVVESDLNIKIDLRMCRRTFGQRYLDAGLDIESTSVLMGHSTTRTTEGFYSRRRNTDAMRRAQGTWDDEEE